MDGSSSAGEGGGPPEWEARGEGQAHTGECGGGPGPGAEGLPPAPPELVGAEPGRPLSPISLPLPPNKSNGKPSTDSV